MNDKPKMKDIGALWKQTSASGWEYWTGQLEDGTRIVAFPKRQDAKENAPDIKIFLSEPNPNHERKEPEVDLDNVDDEIPF